MKPILTSAFLFLITYSVFAVGFEAPQKVKIGKASAWLEIADDESEIVQVLSDREELEPNHGMLFVFPEAAPRTFWMYHCYMDIDLAYVDSNGVIQETMLMKAEPLSTLQSELKTYPSASDKIQYVIEMAPGWFEEHHVKAGDQTDVTRFQSKVKDDKFR